jgi:peptidyl-tRNA hydrolase
MGKIKLYCVMAKESIDKMKGIRGKMITQGGHAYLHTVWDAQKRFPEMVEAYRDSGHAFKITLVVPTVADLETLYEAYRDKCGVSLVKDAGFTVFKDEDGNPQPTITCLGIGPIREDDVGEDLSSIKTFT